jgi:hypothetical protein
MNSYTSKNNSIKMLPLFLVVIGGYFIGSTLFMEIFHAHNAIYCGLVTAFTGLAMEYLLLLSSGIAAEVRGIDCRTL